MSASSVSFRRFVATGETPARRFHDWKTWAMTAHRSRHGVATFAPVPPQDNFQARYDLLEVDGVALVDLQVGPHQATYSYGHRPRPDLRIEMFHRNPGMTGSWRDLETPVRAGDIYLFTGSNGAHRVPHGCRSSSIVLPRSLIQVDHSVIAQFGHAALPLEAPLVSGLLRPMLAGAVGRVEQLGGLSDLSALRKIWLTIIESTLNSLADLHKVDEVATRRRQVTSIIDARMAEPGLNPAMIADQMGMSRRSLYALLGDEGGVASMLRERRLARARDLLLSDSLRTLQIVDVGRTVGLPTPAHFTRLFKSAHGVSPTEYRLNAQGPWIGPPTGFPTGAWSARSTTGTAASATSVG